ncbi:BON domain-containing protein [Limnoglobus roseus]|uniref:BON domain-containing protein n=1 Tax=Limnoglobus roseus TaxID=2598579 RepID=A0A5C1A515_9BACT|nr:BON domain-containing protein [Limnoglobus roseus]QEL13770.1 BON domain-containing protein [Limnoglobus roseus]
MSLKRFLRFLSVSLFLFILVGTLALSRAEDLNILLKAGRKAKEQVGNALPDGQKLAGPLAAFRAGDALPVEERVRVRIQTDKGMTGSEVAVATTDKAGEVRLRGVVQTTGQKQRAVELANLTNGVEKVFEELAVPEGK